VILDNLAQQIPNFCSKLITHTITILYIDNYAQKGNKEKNKGKPRRLGTIMPGQVLSAYLNFASI